MPAQPAALSPRASFPLTPEEAGPLHSRAIFRAVAAKVLALQTSRNAVGAPESAEEVARRQWPRDETAVAVLRAATGPATTTGATWAAPLAPTVMAAFLRDLAPQSAAARLFGEALRIDLAGVAQVLLPQLSSDLPAPVFVLEGAPIPVVQGTLANVSLSPKKMAFSAVITAELERFSAEDAEAIVRAAMAERAAKALDAAVFSAAAGSPIRPPGILAGVTPIAAAAGGGSTAISADIKALTAAIATAGGGANLRIFAAPSLAAVLKLSAGAGFDQSVVVPVPALAPATVVALDLGAIVSGFNGLPQFDVSDQGLVHLEDSAPLDVGTVPNIVATPLRSLFQVGGIAVRMILRCAWAVRGSGLVQVVNSATW